jgi:hypothetical protein
MYASLGDLKLALRIPDDDENVLLQVALDAATSAIDDHCNRTFIASAGVSPRMFQPTRDRVEVDDFFTTEGLIISVGGTVIPAAVENVSAGYTLYPLNAEAQGEPYTSFQYTQFPSSAWPLYAAISRAKAIVTARWGYAAAVPAQVRQACILQASRIFARRLSPYGVAGSPDMGSELRILAKVDPDVAVLLAGLVRF